MLANTESKNLNIEKIQPDIPPSLSNNKRDELGLKNTRDARKTQFGIDCADLVHFSHWYTILMIGNLVANMSSH